jgi:hypothetical protein
MSGPPFESSLPIALACGAAAGIAAFIWTRLQTRPWLWVASLALLAGVAALIADRQVVTHREFLESLLPRLAAAAERAEIDTILAAIDPEAATVREEARRVLARAKPAEVRITRLKVAVDETKQPAEATADLIVRVTGTLLEPGAGQGSGLAEVHLRLHRTNGTWLVYEAESDAVRPGQP